MMVAIARGGIGKAGRCRRIDERTGRLRVSGLRGIARGRHPQAGRQGPGVLFSAILAFAAACTTERPEAARPVPPGELQPALPEIPRRTGPLVLDVVHPEEGATVPVRDSTFVFGSTGTGDATLRINGTPVPVQPNGTFLAFLPVPPDGVYRITAHTARESAELVRTVVVPPPPPTLPPGVVGILESSIQPRGVWVALPGERIDVSFRGSPGGTATLILPDGQRIALVEAAAEVTAAAGQEAFSRDPNAAREQVLSSVSEYRGSFQAVPIAPPDTMPVGTALLYPFTSSGDLGADAPLPGQATLELVVGSDTARALLPLELSLLDPDRLPVALTRDPTDPPRAPGGEVRGLPASAGVFHYFWPDGTRVALSGERNGMVRVRLTASLSAWVAGNELVVLPGGTPPPTSRVGPIRMSPTPGWIDVRFNLDERLPFRVDQGERSFTVTLYGGTSRTDWLQYGALDPLIERAEWSQPRDDEFRFDLHLTRAPWGYRTFWDGDDLILRVRRSPEIDPDRPLRGLLIALDPGHPPLGAIGPTRLTEAEANLAIAFALRPILEAAGARVIMTRTDTTAVPLYARTTMATEANAHLFISIHNNAFPDGVNPFRNNGTSTYYFYPQSVDLARALLRELLRELRLRDLGYGRGDLAAVRHTWMPAALTETMFLMIPRQEAALRDPEVIERIARAHYRGIEAFVRAHAGRSNVSTSVNR
ncbi:MAG: N-acetylmuramoyl-L-alanine amidase [Gemmatimonadota bacterium]